MQSLLYFTTFNLINLTVSSLVLFRGGNIITVHDILLMTLSYGTTVLILIKFFVDPDPLGYFRYSFRYTAKSCFYELSFNHHLIVCLCTVSTIIMCVLLPEVPYAPLALMSVLGVFIIAYHPYKDYKDNFRSFFNVFIICFILGVRILQQVSS